MSKQIIELCLRLLRHPVITMATCKEDSEGFPVHEYSPYDYSSYESSMCESTDTSICESIHTSVCGGCENVVLIETFCSECHFWLCGNCKNSHKKFPATKHHVLRSNEDVVEELKQEAQQMLSEAGSSRQICRDRIAEVIKEEQRIGEEREKSVRDIQQQAEVLHREIDGLVKKLNEEVDTFYTKCEKKNHDSLSVWKGVLHGFDEYNELLEHTKDSQDGSMSQELIKTAKLLMSDDLQRKYQEMKDAQMNRESLLFSAKQVTIEKLDIGVLSKG